MDYKVFVLYYSESDYDYHQMGIIKVSKDRDKLEILKKQYEQEAAEFAQSARDFMARQQEFYRNERNKLADWFEQNTEAILEYPRGQKYSGSQKYPDKKNFIKQVRETISSSSPYKWEEYVNYLKIKTPFPKSETFPEPRPQTQTENQCYPVGTLFIEEVEEI